VYQHALVSIMSTQCTSTPSYPLCQPSVLARLHIHYVKPVYQHTLIPIKSTQYTSMPSSIMSTQCTSTPSHPLCQQSAPAYLHIYCVALMHHTSILLYPVASRQHTNGPLCPQYKPSGVTYRRWLPSATFTNVCARGPSFPLYKPSATACHLLVNFCKL
jgi:hypothetical protein